MGWAVRPRLVGCAVGGLLALACWLARTPPHTTPALQPASKDPPAETRLLRVGATCVLLQFSGSPNSALGTHLLAHLNTLPLGPAPGCGPVLALHLAPGGLATVGLAKAPAAKALVLGEDTDRPVAGRLPHVLLPPLLDTAPAPPLPPAQQAVYVLQSTSGSLLAAPLPWATPLGTSPPGPFQPVGPNVTVGGALCVSPSRLAAYWALHHGCVPVMAPGPPLAHVPPHVVVRLQPGQAVQASNLAALLRAVGATRQGLGYHRGGGAWALALQQVAARLRPGLARLPGLGRGRAPARAAVDDEDLAGVGEGRDDDDPADDQPAAGPEAWQLLLGPRVFGPPHAMALLAGLADGTEQGVAAAQQAAGLALGASGPPTVLATYRRLHRARGPSYVLHVQAQGRVHRVAVQAHYGAHVEATARGSVDAGPLHVLVALEGRAHTAQRFGTLLRGLMASDRALHLVVAVFGGQQAVGATRQLLADTLGPHSHRLAVLPVDGPFSRARGLHAAALHVQGGLLFLCDVDMIVTAGALQRCRANTVQASQVYFPVVYSLQPGQLGVGAGGGFFRESGLGMACLHVADYLHVGGFAQRQWEAWGGEDVYLHGRFVAAGTYSVFRAYEPGLLHLWHPKACPQGLSAAMAANCLRVLQAHLGAQHALARLLYAQGHNVLP